MNDIKWYELKMTSNTTPAPFVTSASSVYSSNFQAWKAFNGTNFDASDCWHSAYTAGNEWIEIDFGENTDIKYFSITGRYGVNPETAPSTFKLLGSNDGVDYTEIHSEQGLSWIIGEEKIFELKNHVSFKRYKLSVISPYNSTYILVGQLKFGITAQKLVLKNPTTNQHYSLAEKTLIPLPDSSDKNMILYGIEAGKEIQLDVPFDKVKYVQDASEILGSGKVFTHTINLNEISLNKIT